MTEHALAVAALVIAAVGLGLDAVALKYLIEIRNDDHEMKIMQQESLAAQLEYLGLRRKWYESRTRKRDDKADVRPMDGGDTNIG